ncbi:RraA family protein [Paenibacillus mendelii]|nr:RraA family protein [Paenibacillus mendelii]
MAVRTNPARMVSGAELLSTASKMRGARGAIVDGLVRDTKKIVELGFPVFATGTKPVDSQGRGLIIDYDIPVLCGGVMVYPGDVIFERQGWYCRHPKHLGRRGRTRSLDKATRENHTRDELLQGRTMRQVYDKYGVL